MDIQEQLALRMARERIEDAVCAAGQMRQSLRAGASVGAGPAGEAMVRPGRWIAGQPSPAPGRGAGTGPRSPSPAWTRTGAGQPRQAHSDAFQEL